MLFFLESVFQSAPLTDVRGDKPTALAGAGHVEFQSAPLTDVRGDAGAGVRNARTRGFNPLPSLM